MSLFNQVVAIERKLAVYPLAAMAILTFFTIVGALIGSLLFTETKALPWVICADAILLFGFGLFIALPLELKKHRLIKAWKNSYGLTEKLPFLFSLVVRDGVASFTQEANGEVRSYELRYEDGEGVLYHGVGNRVDKVTAAEEDEPLTQEPPEDYRRGDSVGVDNNELWRGVRFRR